MRAVAVTPAEPGQVPGPEALHVVEIDDPTPASGEVIVDVAAAGLNRADLLQRMGFYPPPPGASDVIGLECSGVISAVGPGVSRWKVGDHVCCLLAGGIGSFALQLLRARGIRAIATASAAKLEACRGFGADEAIDYTTDWVTAVQELGGADVILDVMGAAYLEKNLAALRDGGRIVVIGLQGGVRG